MIKPMLLVFAVSIGGSGISQEVLATSGEDLSNTNGSVSYTLGETVIFTGSDGSNELTQGFQQTGWDFVSLEDFNANYNVTIFPNPVQEQLNITIDVYSNVDYILINASGQVVSSGKITSTTTSINVENYSTGKYSLIIKKENEKLKNFNIIKTK